VQQDTFFEPAVLEVLADGSTADLTLGLEDLLSPDLELRRKGLKTLVEMDAHRRSPLAAAVIAGQIREPDIDLRTRIAAALAEVCVSASDTERPPVEVRSWVRRVLTGMRTREIYSLLQVIAYDADQTEQVCSLLQACSFSGETMLAIVKDGRADIAIRVAAVKAIAVIGYLDAIVVLEQLNQRIAGQIAGQIPMAFAGRLEAEAEQLLPALQEALHLLAEVAD
jgi:hypothetical protein